MTESWDIMWQSGKCPNGCGDMTQLKTPIDIVLLLPEEALEEWMDLGSLGFITAVCPKCGFTLTRSGDEEDE